MCWRDNQRDYRAENARRELSRMRHESDQKGKRWELNATPAQKRAAKSLELLYALLPLAFTIRKNWSDPYALMGNKVHCFFEVFAKKVGLKGIYYRTKSGLCPAVVFAHCMSGIHDPQNPYATIGSIFPSFSENNDKDWENCLTLAAELKVTRNKKILLNAAEAFLDAVSDSDKHPAATL